MTGRHRAPTQASPRRKGQWSVLSPLLPAVLFIVLLFVLPVGFLLTHSLADTSGAFTLEHYERLLGSPLYVDVLIATFRISLLTTLICVIGGYPVAFLLANTPGSSRRLLLLCVLMPFWTSVLVRCFAWMVILGRRGLINHTLVSSGAVETPLELMYGSGAVLVGMSHALMPLAILTMLSVMDNIDTTLMRAASSLGARPGSGFWRIYFPLSLPGVVAAGLLVFVSSIGFFITPILLGGPSEMMIVQIIVTQMDEMLDWGFAGALAILLLVAALVILVVFDRVLGLASLTGEMQARGRGRSRGGSALGRAFYAGLGRATDGLVAMAAKLRRRRPAAADSRRAGPLLWAAGLAIIFFLAAPSFVLVPISFTEDTFIAWPPRGFSLDWYASYFDSSVWRNATIRSFWIAFWTGLLSMLLGVPAAFIVARRQFRSKPLVMALFIAPMIMPHIIVAVGLYYLYARLGLVGTTLGIVLGHTIFSLPYVVITTLAVLRTYDGRLDQAAATLGARRLTAFRRITMPIIKTGLITAFIFAFVKSFDELTVALFIAGGASTTLPRQIWSETLHNVTPTIAAASTVLLILIALAIFVSEWVNRPKAGKISSNG